MRRSELSYPMLSERRVFAAVVLRWAIPQNSSSLDAAVLVTLNPGTYTAQVTSASGASGFVLIEVYEVP